MRFSYLTDKISDVTDYSTRALIMSLVLFFGILISGYLFVKLSHKDFDINDVFCQNDCTATIQYELRDREDGLLAKRELLRLTDSTDYRFDEIKETISYENWKNVPSDSSRIKKARFEYRISHDSKDIDQFDKLFVGNIFSYYSIKKSEWIFVEAFYEENDFEKLRTYLKPYDSQ